MADCALSAKEARKLGTGMVVVKDKGRQVR